MLGQILERWPQDNKGRLNRTVLAYGVVRERVANTYQVDPYKHTRLQKPRDVVLVGIRARPSVVCLVLPSGSHESDRGL
ncbi:predicted protein [Pyrenophora tritici-repentis Pt-1C-BFP]|uniref:Uncharacterized protein n=1 Tax=Pyrenophora tritici-repentis (strain Pt-1C-BFP) TaxID=426418 RepID=B2VYZ1_PYRTR|nr:uncharacterized protein PTRG_02631 [Pyrenophora tritici-repentis Pt-1C-BFP]EDU45154.1 predicted protein [Pyrenophora tritici-repentis Pt-1C-BFP]